MALHFVDDTMQPWHNFSKTNYTRIPSWGGNIVGTTLVVLTVVSVIGNLAVIYVLGRNRRKRRVHLFQINLAICELLSPVLTYCMTIVAAFLTYWPFGKTNKKCSGCHYYGFISGWLALNSIICLTAVAIERYVVISRPFLERRLTIQVKMSFALVTWIYSFILAVPPLFGVSRYTLEGYRISCCFDYISRDNVSRSYLFYLFSGGFIIPVITIAYCYSKIYLHCRRHSQFVTSIRTTLIPKVERWDTLSEQEIEVTTSRQFNFGSSTNDQLKRQNSTVSSIRHSSLTSTTPFSSPNRQNIPVRKRYRSVYEEIQLAKLIILVTIVFIISWVSYSLVSLTAQFGQEGIIINPTVMVITNLMAKFSVVYNPFIYWWKDGSFRRNVKQLLFCRTSLQSRSDV